MVLGIGYGELLFLLGTGVLIIGPKDLPFAARTAGRAAGRAVAYVSAFRKQALSFAEETEITKLHEELHQSLQQLQAIRSELQSGVNIFNPGPVARRVLQNSPAGRSAAPAAESFNRRTQASAGPGTAGSRQAVSVGAASHQLQGINRGLADSITKELADSGMSPLPISAVLAGRSPKREGGSATGADIMMDALAEEEVAHAAQQILGVHMKAEVPMGRS